MTTLHCRRFQKNVHRDIGASGVFHWDELPDVVRPQYAAMAKLLASAGYNAIVLNNINACDLPTGNRQLLSAPTLAKAGVLARVFAAHGACASRRDVIAFVRFASRALETAH